MKTSNSEIEAVLRDFSIKSAPKPDNANSWLVLHRPKMRVSRPGSVSFVIDWKAPRFLTDDDDCPLCKDGKHEKTLSTNALALKSRQHKKRRNQTENYHRRIQKKWDKISARNQVRSSDKTQVLTLPSKAVEWIHHTSQWTPGSYDQQLSRVSRSNSVSQ